MNERETVAMPDALVNEMVLKFESEGGDIQRNRGSSSSNGKFSGFNNSKTFQSVPQPTAPASASGVNTVFKTTVDGNTSKNTNTTA